MELRQLRVFVEVAAERSFTRAAERMYLAQSAVSMSVQSLERELGVSLFDRSVQPIALTVPGNVFLEYARQIITTADSAIQAARQEVGGTVTVGFMSVRRSDSPSVPAVIASFRKAYPAVTVLPRHVEGSLAEAELVRDGHLDLAVLSLGATAVSGVRTLPLWSEPISYVCRNDHPLATARTVTAAQFAPYPLVSLPRNWCVSTTLEGWSAERSVSLHQEYVVNDVNALLDFVIDGAAAALLPASFVPKDSPLVAVPIASHPTFVTELATPLHRVPTPAGAAFTSWVQDHMTRPSAAEAAAR